MDERLREHYEGLARQYNDYWQYSRDFVEWMACQIQSRLAVTPKHKLVDLGGGTGLYAGALADQLAPESPVLCVDSSEAMLAEAPPHDAVKTIAADAEQFMLDAGHVDRIFMKEVIHHIDNKERLFARIYDRLPRDGVFVLVLLPPRIDYPLFGAALDQFEALQPNYKTMEIELRKAGFVAVSSDASYLLQIEKARYLDMVRNRYMSLLTSFSDEQLEAGVSEIDQAHSESVLEFVDRFVFVVAVKP